MGGGDTRATRQKKGRHDENVPALDFFFCVEVHCDYRIARKMAYRVKERTLCIQPETSKGIASIML